MGRGLGAEPDIWPPRVGSHLLPGHKSGAAPAELPSRREGRPRAMNPSLANDWPIKHRADVCAKTQRPFEPGEKFYTLLFREGDGFRREDLSEEGWAQRNENIHPFSFWKSRYEPPPATPPEPLGKENAEDLLRRLLSENNPANANACYVLAVMLERKRVLKQVKKEETED